MGKVISQIKTINTVLSENLLHKINKKKENYHWNITSQKLNFSKILLQKFLRFPTDP